MYTSMLNCGDGNYASDWRQPATAMRHCRFPSLLQQQTAEQRTIAVAKQARKLMNRYPPAAPAKIWIIGEIFILEMTYYRLILRIIYQYFTSLFLRTWIIWHISSEKMESIKYVDQLWRVRSHFSASKKGKLTVSFNGSLRRGSTQKNYQSKQKIKTHQLKCLLIGFPDSDGDM